MVGFLETPRTAPEPGSAPRTAGGDGAPNAADRAGEPRPYRPSLRVRFLRDVLRGFLLIVLLHLFVVQVSIVRGESMQPCLQDGDRLLVDRVSYSLTPVDRFDVVVLRNPRDPSVDYVKRVIGLPGDVVELRDGRLCVNGAAVPESFGPIHDHADLPPVTVPPGFCFVLGDNRPVSCDSREFGFVALTLLRGKVRARFWPPSRVAVF
ncbi:MAG: signal peptidase I [Planctomycetes bacterium]|nr:signal peptidase I [Planctomycetota bacterium]